MKPKKTRLIIYISLSIALMVFIFVQSALNADISKMESGWISEFVSGLLHIDPELASFIVRKMGHFTEYTLLGVLLSLTFREIAVQRRAARQIADISGIRLYYPIAWAAGTLYAVTDELHQTFVDGRSCELRDIGIDSAGVLLGMLIVLIVYIVKERRKDKTNN